MLWAQNELSPVESVVAAHSLMLAHNGTLYYDLNQYPYTVSAYMPIFYSLEAGLLRLGLPPFVAGRVISLAAFMGIIWVASRMVRVYTEDRTSAWIAAILVGISPLLIFWGVVGHVDVLAIFFAVTAFYQFSRHYVLGEPVLWRAGVFAALAVLTKQTMIAAPMAIVLVLALRDWKKALRFGLMLGLPLGAVILALNAALDGRFFQNTVFANMNPLSAAKLLTQLQYFGGVSGGLLVLAFASLIGLGRSLGREKTLAPFVYLGCTALVFLATAPKLGSDTNYEIEISIALAICAAIGLHQLDFLRLFCIGSKNWITLLILPLGVHVFVGARVVTQMFISRVAYEQSLRGEVQGLKAYVTPGSGRLLSSNYNAMVRLRQRMDVEPLIYGLLVDAGLVDPGPVLHDLDQQAFSVILLSENVFLNEPPRGPEFASLPAAQLDSIRRHYHLAAQVPGPYLDGVFVYQPNQLSAGKAQ